MTLFNNPGGGDEYLFWELYLLEAFEIFTEDDMILLGKSGVEFQIGVENKFKFKDGENKVYWNPSTGNPFGANYDWCKMPYLAGLAHELGHALGYNTNPEVYKNLTEAEQEAQYGYHYENKVRKYFYDNIQGFENTYARFWNYDHNLASGINFLFYMKFKNAANSWDYYDKNGGSSIAQQMPDY